MSFLKSNSGVSHLIGYMLTLSLTTVIIVVTIVTTNTLIDEKAGDAAEIYAENIANQVASAILNVCAFKEDYPNADHLAVLEIPAKLVDRFSYYIQIDKSGVYVKSYDGKINEKSTIYNATEKQSIYISSKISSSYGAINISCDSYDYVHKFDFGSNTSKGSTGYTRVTNSSNNNKWPGSLRDWTNRTPIIITNPVGKTLQNYSVLIQLDDTNFDYSSANSNGSDLRFINKTGFMLNYWIERWYPRDTHTSRIWVNITSLSYPAEIIYMYHSKRSASPMSNGEATFDFFDDFSTSLSKWETYIPGDPDDIFIDDGEIAIKNGSAINSTIKIGSSPCVIEAKAKTVGDKREASMFARNDEDGGVPYSHAYLFASGNFTTGNKNLSIIENYPSTPKNSSELPVSQGWNRLVYIINKSDIVVCRYFYENYTVDGALSYSTSNAVDSHFGLCTTESGTTAYYDWIFVRKFEANVSEGVASPEESIPIAYVCGTDSQDYEWSIPSNINSGEHDVGSTSYDFACNSTNAVSATFTITNLTNEVHSLVFTVGDPQKVVENMTITINGNSHKAPSCDNSYKKMFFYDIFPNFIDGNYQIELVFDDADAPSDYYWAVGDLTIQRGERIINILGGK